MNNTVSPKASLCLFFYNQQDFVDDAIEGALSQTYDDLEIILSDDHSTDDTLNRIKKKVSEYRGNKNIIINANQTNLGIVPHVNKVIYELSHGKYIFLTGGDDISLPNRVAAGVKYFETNKNLSMVSFSYEFINEKSEITGVMKVDEDILHYVDDYGYLKSSSFMDGFVGQGFRRDILEEYGPMGDCQTEDSVLRFRSIMKGPVLSSSKIGLRYRRHSNNISDISRIYRYFQTNKIAAQYLRDLEHNKSILDSMLYHMLKRKIDYYIKYRKISEKLSNNTLCFVMRLFYRGVHFFQRIKYEKIVHSYMNSLHL